MPLIVKSILLCSLVMSALCVTCDRDSQCTVSGVIRCPSGQRPTCSQGQCFCKANAWCALDRNCRDNCLPTQTYHCNYLRCYCGGLSI